MQKFEFTALTKIGKQAVCGSYLHDVIIDRHYIFHPEQVAEDDGCMVKDEVIPETVKQIKL